MKNFKIKSYAKINLALNITGKNTKLHKIESIVSFIDLHDLIYLKLINNKDHKIFFKGKFSRNISKINTITTLLRLLDTLLGTFAHKFSDTLIISAWGPFEATLSPTLKLVTSSPHSIT